jgi:hypothetical protein
LTGGIAEAGQSIKSGKGKEKDRFIDDGVAEEEAPSSIAAGETKCSRFLVGMLANTPYGPSL